jgi:hypothetical protein
MEDPEIMEEAKNKFILYTAPSGEVRVDVFLEGETVWLTQKGDGRAVWCTKTCNYKTSWERLFQRIITAGSFHQGQRTQDIPAGYRYFC